jgi:hypothetical protein
MRARAAAQARPTVVVCAAGRIEPDGRPEPLCDRACDARERRRVVAREVRCARPSGEVDGAPDTAPTDEGGPERSEQLPVACASLRAPACRVAEDPDRLPPVGQAGERVHVVHEVLARDEQPACSRRAVPAKEPVFDELLRRVARHERRLRVERVPAGCVEIHGTAQPAAELAVVPLARQAAAPEK